MENKNLTIQYSLDAIQILEFALIATSYKQDQEVTLTTSIDIIADVERRVLGFKMTFEFFQQEDNLKPDKKMLLKLKTACNFELENKSWESFVQIGENNDIGLPDALLKFFINFTVDTSRGILTAKTQGTIYASLYFPLLDINQIAQEMQSRYQEGSKVSEQNLSETKANKLKKLKSRKEKQIPKVM